MFSEILGIAASVSTIVGLVIIVVQQIRQSSSLEADIRSYLHLDIKKSKFSDGREMILLTIYNSGEVAAEEVRISPELETKWFALNGDSGPEFSKSNSKLRVLPGEELVFLLGPINGLPEYAGPGINVNVEYVQIPGRKRRANEKQILTLEPHKYLIERRIH